MINGIILLGILVSVLGGPVIDGPQAEAFGVCDNVCETGAVLVLTEEISGRIYIRDLEDLLVVELKKPFGNRVEVGLEEGEYLVVNVRDGDVYESAIALCRGDFMELTPGMFLRDRGGDPPQENFYSQTQKDTLIRDGIETHITGGLDIKTTRIFDEHSVLIGGNIGLTLNRNFYIGVAGYSRAVHDMGLFDLEVDFDSGSPSYGGFVLGYSFLPMRKVHFMIETLLGGGDSWRGSFGIVEPRIEMVLNINQIIRLRFGLAMPFTNQKKAGMENIMLNFGIQFGE